jgi:hypothetical protein
MLYYVKASSLQNLTMLPVKRVQRAICTPVWFAWGATMIFFVLQLFQPRFSFTTCALAVARGYRAY